MTDAYIIDAARTPRGIGKAGRGALAHLHSGRLLAKVLEAIRDRNDLNTDDVDDLVVGCSSQVGNQGSCVAIPHLVAGCCAICNTWNISSIAWCSRQGRYLRNDPLLPNFVP